ncbi:sensor histidine kinase [Pengzhenrongella sp.]|uniref:sensor histidine kinase n=1 Tax=Pengzhenrongella sp. TaxID=2888820 RepID=UPI002F9237A2
MTVRARMLTAVLALAALAMAIAGATSTFVQIQRTDLRIDDSLSRAAQDLRDFAAADLDPETSKPFESLDHLLYLAVQRRAPAAQEGVVALADGNEEWLAAPTVSLRLEKDPELMSVLRHLDPGATPHLRTLRTQVTQYRFVALPVSVSGDNSHGFFVVAVDRAAEHRALMVSFRSYAVVALGSLVVIGAVGWLVVGGLLRPVRLLRDTARHITETDLSERIPVTGRDDLSDLAHTVNAMLDRLELAFGSQRRLLDDVGHELRTPLTVVRGHLELMDAANHADVQATRALALDELDRMHRLVDDLVTLATVDRPDFVRPAPTDLGRLTDDVLDKARPLGDRRWQVEARADAIVVLDAQRITQAWLQLISNAVTYAPQGARIRIGSAVRGDRALIWVHDDGPGVAAQDLDLIFDRFARGDGARGTDGAGLGLPIVAAIANAHHGTVRLARAGGEQPDGGPIDTRGDQWGPLRGARFVIDLPSHQVADPDEFADELDLRDAREDAADKSGEPNTEELVDQ